MGRYATLAIDKSNYQELIETIREGYTDYNGVKHRPNNQLATILILEANLGCRIGDIIALTTDSIVYDGGIYKLNITEQKTGKKRSFIVPKPVKAFIDNYIREANIYRGPLFDIKAPAVWKQLRAVTGYLGLENTSTHSFRKYAANSLYEATGHDIEAVCEFLNHSSTNVTRRYIKRSDAMLESAIEKCVDIV
jgi:integrase